VESEKQQGDNPADEEEVIKKTKKKRRPKLAPRTDTAAIARAPVMTRQRLRKNTAMVEPPLARAQKNLDKNEKEGHPKSSVGVEEELLELPADSGKVHCTTNSVD
jgi:hypothetical protein